MRNSWTLLAARRSPRFSYYFDLIWKELGDMSGTVSAAHREYLRRRARRRAAVQLARWAVLVAAVSGEAAARWRLVDPFITSQPSRIWQGLSARGRRRSGCTWE